MIRNVDWRLDKLEKAVNPDHVIFVWDFAFVHRYPDGRLIQQDVGERISLTFEQLAEMEKTMKVYYFDHTEVSDGPDTNI